MPNHPLTRARRWQRAVRIFSLALVVVTLTASCRTFYTLPEPNSGKLNQRVKVGDQVNITLRSGLRIESIEVKQVWPDSVLVGNDTRPIRAADLTRIEGKRVDPVLTILGVLISFPIAMLLIFWSSGGAVM